MREELQQQQQQLHAMQEQQQQHQQQHQQQQQHHTILIAAQPQENGDHQNTLIIHANPADHESQLLSTGNSPDPLDGNVMLSTADDAGAALILRQRLQEPLRPPQPQPQLTPEEQSQVEHEQTNQPTQCAMKQEPWDPFSDCIDEYILGI